MTGTFAPLLLAWDGEALIPPTPRWQKKCDDSLVVGQQYMIVEHHDRSMNSHRQYFAAVHEGWANLPEVFADAPWAASSEHLRAYALIKCGYFDSRTIVCASKAEAQRFAAFLRPIDSFSIVDVKEATVIHYTARSQSMKAMDRKEFQKSKSDVLNCIEDLIGTPTGSLTERAA